MATWREVIQDENYKKLPLGERVKTKNEFFKYTISQSDKFKSLPIEKQKQLKTDFFTPKPEESLEPFSEEKPTIGGIARTAVEQFQTKSPFALLDRPVEEAAKFIEPDKAEPGVAGALKFIPRQMAAEALRAYKPSTAGAFGLGMKAIKPIARPVGKFIVSKTPQVVKEALKPIGRFLNKNLTVGKGQPKAYQEIAQEAELERGVGAREAEQVAKTLTTKEAMEVSEVMGIKNFPGIKPKIVEKQIPLDEQQYIGRIFRKETIESPELLAHPKYQELKAISDEGRAIMDKWSTELAKSGIPKAEAAKVIEENVGSYMARMYKAKLKPEQEGVGLFKDLRLRLNGLKHRKDLSEDVRNLMGEIKEPALPTAIRVREISSSIANNKLFSKVAQNPEWTSATNTTGKLIKMPDSPSVGALKGKWVVPEIAEDINAITKIGQQSQGMYLKALSAWKYGKVVLNPAAQTRNALSNTILLDLSGTNHLRQAQLFPKAFDEIISKGKVYQQALNDGAIGGEFAGTETMQKLKEVYLGSQKTNLQKWMDVASTPFKKAGEVYQGMEQTAKLVKYMDVLDKTGNSKLAAQEAQKWLFNYNKVPKFIDVLRKSPIGAPFITFTYKSIPRIAEAMVNRPMAVYKYKALFDTINETSRKYQGMTPVEYSRQKKLLPPWVLKDIGGVPTNLLMPWKDKYNRTQWLNLEYILPVGQAPEMAERGLAGFVSSPAFNIVSDIIKNTDFKNTSIIPPEATKTEAAKAISEYIYRQIVPSLAPGGYSAEKIRAGFAKEPEKFNPERTREAIPALLDSLVGIKINPLDVDEAEQFKWFNKKKRLDSIKQEMYRVINNPVLKEDFREKRIEELFNKQEKVLEE